MTFNATVYRIMLASPSDVTTERDCARGIIHEWNVVHAAARRIVLLPISWETHATPSVGVAPQEQINREVLQRADLLVGIFWTRLGTKTQSHPSGTVEELERHISAGKPAMLYFSEQPLPPEKVDAVQYERLKSFKVDMRRRGLYDTYGSIDDFRDKFYRQLQLKLNDTGLVGGNRDIRGDDDWSTTSRDHWETEKIRKLSPEAVRLLFAGSRDPQGQITRRKDLGGVTIHSNKETFYSHGDARTLATWDGALAELRLNGLIETVDYSKGISRLTRDGYEAADELS